jgi:predicted aconitase with swiveling domain
VRFGERRRGQGAEAPDLAALVGWGGIDQCTGTVVESGHELARQPIAGKILVFPAAKGSSGWSGVLHRSA